MAQTADSLLFDLANTLAGQTKFLANLLQGHLLTTDTEEILDDILLAIGQRRERTLNLGAQRLVDQATIGIGRVGIYQHIQQAVVLAIGKGSIHRDMSS